jgi:hypothetical protein
MKGYILAVRAIKRSINLPEKTFSTGFTKRTDNAWELFFTCLAEDFAVLKSTTAQLADRRIDPV